MKCPYCKKQAPWIDNKLVYGKRYGKSYMCYYCGNCDAYVGCHNNTRKALGTMANKALRRKRMAVHAVIDPIWKSGKETRKQVYAKLKQAFGHEVHVGEANEQDCEDIIKTAKMLWKEPTLV